MMDNRGYIAQAFFDRLNREGAHFRVLDDPGAYPDNAPPEVQIATPPPPQPTITAVTPTPPPAPAVIAPAPPPVVAAPAPPPPAAPVVASAGVVCPGYQEKVKEAGFPREANRAGLTRGERLDLEFVIGHFGDALHEEFAAAIQRIEGLRPAGRQPPLNFRH